MQTDGTKLSPQMEAVIRQLATVYSVDLSQPSASLSLAMPTRSDRWIITHLDGARISVTRCVVEAADCLSLELDMVFLVHPMGWEPVELVHSTALWAAYAAAANAAGIAVYQDNGDPCFARFTEYWAQQLHHQGWLTQAYQVKEVEWNDNPTGAPMAGCQSTHPGPCYGELWSCAVCAKIVCFAEGSDDHPELCDACWCQRYAVQKEDEDAPG